jgi:hypothetical protein
VIGVSLPRYLSRRAEQVLNAYMLPYSWHRPSYS